MPRLPITACLLTFGLLPLSPVPRLQAGPPAQSYWQVEDVRIGMKGQGRTVMKGTRVETFDAEVLGVLRNTSPGRDLVLCRLSGLGLERTGVIAGMSGSPVYIDDKLLGAVAYAWAFGKDPIAGITPFAQMHGFVEEYERRDLAEQARPRRVGLHRPLLLDGKEYSAVTVSESFEEPTPQAADGLYLVPLRTPLVATGLSARALALLGENCRTHGLAPMQGGGVPARVAEQEKDTPLVAGGPLSVAMIRGDFDLSGIGTVTHIEGKRVYGWGHPFMSLGGCDFPLMTGYIHTVYPRQTVSFKMGSPLRTVGVINADVSTCVAGWLGREPDMMPMRMTVVRDGGRPRTFNVELVRQPSLMPSLVLTALAGSVDMEGELPDEVTAHMSVRIELEDREPIVLDDVYSGFTGRRAPQLLYNQVATLVQALVGNAFEPVRITRIEATTRFTPERQLATIEAVESSSEVYAPGDTVAVRVFLRPHRGDLQRVTATLRLPDDLPEGDYTLTVCDDVASTRQDLQADPRLTRADGLEDVLRSLHLQAGVRRRTIALRLPRGPSGVVHGGKALPSLPGSMLHIFRDSRRTGVQTMTSALVSHLPTEWVIEGSEQLRIQVARDRKRVSR